jgi:AcrR family transcriptional regulator
VLDTPYAIRQAERREATRREIIDAAWAVARETGLSQLTLRDVAERVRMRAPSLYSHFDSKNAIYDAMFGDAWSQCHAHMVASLNPPPRTARSAIKRIAHAFFDFCVSDLARHQLMNQRTIPGFEPSPEAYASSIATYQVMLTEGARWGIRRQQDTDLMAAIIGGLVDGQLANDPGGHRYERLIDRAMDMYADGLGL